MLQLVVVESPGKVKKIQSILGSDFRVVATLGHFVDLPPRELGIDLKTMEPTYEPIEGKQAVLKRLRAEAKGATRIVLATDPDREGEAIAWHVARVIGEKGRGAKRARFHEITPNAVRKAIAEAKPVDLNLVDAQQARRVLDRLCGYQISPLLWPVRKGLSAGRVQSATLHLVVEREKQRRTFNVQTYFEVIATYDNSVIAAVAQRDAKTGKVERQHFFDAASAETVARELRAVPHHVAKIEQKETLQHPKPPFTTSSLQQVASSELKLSPEETMRVAQALFEAGLITYHRTDSVQLSDEAVCMARDFIAGAAPEALPPQPPKYKSKASSQEAHEAIRPTELLPRDDAFAQLPSEARKLWDLVRARFLASQCKPAVILGSLVLIEAGRYLLMARTAQVLDPGYRRFWGDHIKDEDAAEDADTNTAGVRMQQGQRLGVVDVEARKGQTKPPARFTEATLVREMERVGIGRPSTYAATVKVLFNREYVQLEKRHVLPTELGELVDTMLVRGFSDLVEPAFTAEWEERLDAVAHGMADWRALCKSFQSGLAAQIAHAQALYAAFAASQTTESTMSTDNKQAESTSKQQTKVTPKPTGKPCPICGKELLLRDGKRGAFLACSGYPSCHFSADPNADSEALVSEHKCPTCSGAMVRRAGARGAFLSCAKYPECRGTRALDGSPQGDAKASAVPCPKCKGPMSERQSAKGAYLKCNEATCGKTIDCKAMEDAKGAHCSECGAPMLLRVGQKGEFLSCSGFPDCRQTAQAPGEKSAEKDGKAA